MIKTVDGFEYPDDAPNPGTCDAGCGKPATWWFGLTNYAYCGDGECLTVMKARYQKPLGPGVGTLDEAQYAESHLANLQQANTALQRMLEQLVDDAVIRDIQLHDALARIATLEAALLENHAWHQAYTDVDGYAGSGLEQTNLAALRAHPDPGLDEQVADWHEGRTEDGRTLHDYLYVPWPPGTTEKQARHYLVGPVRFDPEQFNSSATKEEPPLTAIDTSPVHTALQQHLEHLLDQLPAQTTGLGAYRLLMAGRAVVVTLQQLQLIDPVEAEALTDRVHAAYRAHPVNLPE